MTARAPERLLKWRNETGFRSRIWTAVGENTRRYRIVAPPAIYTAHTPIPVTLTGDREIPAPSGEGICTAQFAFDPDVGSVAAAMVEAEQWEREYLMAEMPIMGIFHHGEQEIYMEE